MCCFTTYGQEGTTVLKGPRIRVGGNTQRSIAAEISLNQVVGANAKKTLALYRSAISGKWRESQRHCIGRGRICFI